MDSVEGSVRQERKREEGLAATRYVLETWRVWRKGDGFSGRVPGLSGHVRMRRAESIPGGRVARGLGSDSQDEFGIGMSRAQRDCGGVELDVRRNGI
jgi:hypothetical protein